MVPMLQVVSPKNSIAGPITLDERPSSADNNFRLLIPACQDKRSVQTGPSERELQSQRALGANRQTVIRWLSVNQIATNARAPYVDWQRLRGPRLISSSTVNSNRPLRLLSKQLLGCRDFAGAGGNDPLASHAPRPMKVCSSSAAEYEWHCIHVVEKTKLAWGRRWWR